jgi:hypothetical protein
MKYSLCPKRTKGRSDHVTLRLVCVPASREADVARVLETLFSLVLVSQGELGHGIEIAIADSPEPDVTGERVFEAPGLSVIRTARGYHLRSRGSFLALDLQCGKATGSLSPAFMNAPLEDQRGLFLFTFLLLFSERGLFGLHAGGVMSENCGFLLVGGSGSGKTTVTCALTRSGWQYLSDDSVLLRRGPSGVEAVAFGRPFHCAPAMFRHFPELPHSEPLNRYGKHLVNVESIYPGQSRSHFQPQVILFPEITQTRSSRLIPLDGTATLVGLLGQGAGLLHGRESMAAQMAILGELTGSVRGFRLLHGADVHHAPRRLSALLVQIANPVRRAA